MGQTISARTFGLQNLWNFQVNATLGYAVKYPPFEASGKASQALHALQKAPGSRHAQLRGNQRNQHNTISVHLATDRQSQSTSCAPKTGRMRLPNSDAGLQHANHTPTMLPASIQSIKARRRAHDALCIDAWKPAGRLHEGAVPARWHHFMCETTRRQEANANSD